MMALTGRRRKRAAARAGATPRSLREKKKAKKASTPKGPGGKDRAGQGRAGQGRTRGAQGGITSIDLACSNQSHLGSPPREKWA